ncbi:MAG: beta-ketoacyl-ACP synthase III [Candidatus Brocadiia bacterium]
MKSLCKLPVEFAGLGSYVPDKVLTNYDLEKMVDTSDEWITKRTGIKERRLVADHQATSDLAVAAAKQALDDAELAPEDVDVLTVCTCTPDHFFPATACLVQDAIGATNAVCYDLEAACSGFVFGTTQAAGMVQSGIAKNALVIGAESLSRFTDFEDRRSCILFGDGAGAAVLTGTDRSAEIIYCDLGADGSEPDILVIPAGGSRKTASHQTVDAGEHYMKLKGREVFKYAVNKLGELVQRIPEETDVALEEIKMIIPHQSNERIIRSVCERAALPLDVAYLNIDRVGNTSAASIPMALTESVEKGIVERDDYVLLLAFGGGLTWGSILFRY